MPSGDYERTSEIREKMSRAGIKRFEDPEERRKISRSHKGLKHSLEAREKMSRSRKGRELSPEHCRNISLAMMGNRNPAGREILASTRKKLSENLTKRWKEPSWSFKEGFGARY